MLISPEQFQLAQELRDLGLTTRFEVGDVVARGFADLGYEEFQVLPGSKVLSLTAGTITAIDAEQRSHFIWLPTIDEVVALLERLSILLAEVNRYESRSWTLTLTPEQDGCGVAVSHASLQTAMLIGLRNVLRDNPELVHLV